MPRKSFFKTSENKSAKSLPDSAAFAKQEPCTTQTAAKTSWTEAALEKANMAVLYDFTGSPKQALVAYNEAIMLLNKVFESPNDCADHTRLKKIYDSYISRVSILTQQLDNNEFDSTPSISIPVAQLSSSYERTPSTKTATTRSQRRSPSLNLIDSQTYHSLSQPATPCPLDPSCSVNSKNAQPNSLTPPSPHKSPQQLPPKSPSSSLFGSIFLKKQSNKSQSKTPASHQSIFSIPSPSKSTPTLSINQQSTSWKKQQSSKKANRSSTELEPLDTGSLSFNCKIELPSLTLPHVEIQKDDDYFDLLSTTATKNLLYSNPEPMLVSMQDLRLKKKGEMETSIDRPEIGSELYENAGHFYNDNDTTTTKQNNTNTTITREQSFSSSSSSNTTITIKHRPPQLRSSASSTLTSNSSIYSPMSSWFYSSTYANHEEDPLAPAQNKNKLPPPPPSPHSLPLPDVNSGHTTTSSFFGEANEYDIDTLTRLLAESAASMPGRSHRTTSSSMLRSIPAVLEEEPIASSIQPSFPTNSLPVDLPYDSQQQLSPVRLSRSASTKSLSSTKSRASSHSSKHNKKSATNDDSPIASPTPTPSNSAKTISFWSKRSTSSSTKQKTIATLPPLHVDHLKDDSSSWMILSPPIISQPSTPRSMTSSVDHTVASPRSSSSTSSKRPIAHQLLHPTHAFGAHATQTAKNKGIDLSLTMTSTTMNQHNKQPTLMARLQQSMEQGGYITDHLHVPEQLWKQKQVRLPAMDAKIMTCEQLVVVLERMHAITRLLNQLDLPQHDITTEALHTLGRLDSILDTIKLTFGKRHPEQQSPPPSTTLALHGKYLPNTTTSSTISSFKDPMAAWSGKLSKSVERMKIETKSSEEQIHAYRSTLIRLFNLTSIFDIWRDIFTALLEKVTVDKTYLYDHLLQKTMMSTGTFHTVICSFVIQDLYLLMDKWMKRNRDWLLD